MRYLEAKKADVRGKPVVHNGGLLTAAPMVADAERSDKRMFGVMPCGCIPDTVGSFDTGALHAAITCGAALFHVPGRLAEVMGAGEVRDPPFSSRGVLEIPQSVCPIVCLDSQSSRFETMSAD